MYLIRQVQSTQEVILLYLKHHIIISHPGSNQFRDTTFHQALGRFGVFQLFTNSHTITCPNQSWKVLFHSMIWHTGQVGIFTSTGRLPSQGESQHTGSHTCILAKCLIKVTHTEQKYRIGKLLLQLGMLLHQRRAIVSLLCHVFIFMSIKRVNQIQSRYILLQNYTIFLNRASLLQN